MCVCVCVNGVCTCVFNDELLTQLEFEQKARAKELEESSILAELIRKQETMQKTLEDMQLKAVPTASNAMTEYLPVATHGVTAISFRLESIAHISPDITQSLSAHCVCHTPFPPHTPFPTHHYTQKSTHESTQDSTHTLFVRVHSL